MGPQEKRLTRELAIYLVRSCARAMQRLPPGATLDLATRRRWFEQAYREWQLTPRVDLAGRSPYEVITAERAGAARQTLSAPRTKPIVELYTDLPTFDFDAATSQSPAADALSARDGATSRATSDLEGGRGEMGETGAWRHFADRLFGSWLDDELDRL